MKNYIQMMENISINEFKARANNVSNDINDIDSICITWIKSRTASYNISKFDEIKCPMCSGRIYKYFYKEEVFPRIVSAFAALDSVCRLKEVQDDILRQRECTGKVQKPSCVP